MPYADYVCFRCDEKEPGSGGPFRDLPIAPKPACPRCRARRWMERQWSGYSIGVRVTSAGEALPRMSHDEVKRLEGLESAVRATQAPPQKTFEVAHGYSVKAVGLSRVGAEVGALAAATMGEQVGRQVGAQAQAGMSLGTSDKSRGQVRPIDEAPVPPPSRRTIQAARWTPTPAEVSEARSAVGA